MVTEAEALELDAWDELCWTLAGGIIDAYYIESLLVGHSWANSVSWPGHDNPLEISKYHILFDKGWPVGAVEISVQKFKEDFLVHKLGEVPMDELEKIGLPDVDFENELTPAEREVGDSIAFLLRYPGVMERVQWLMEDRDLDEVSDLFLSLLYDEEDR